MRLDAFWGYPQTPKAWGTEYTLINSPKYCGKFLELHPGFQCSLHAHETKEETFYIMEGTPLIQVGADGRWEEKIPGDMVHLPPGTYHRFAAHKGRAVILEISSHHDDEDVIRLEPSQEYLPF